MPPIKGDHFMPPIKGDHFMPPIKGDHFMPPIARDLCPLPSRGTSYGAVINSIQKGTGTMHENRDVMSVRGEETLMSVYRYLSKRCRDHAEESRCETHRVRPNVGHHCRVFSFDDELPHRLDLFVCHLPLYRFDYLHTAALLRTGCERFLRTEVRRINIEIGNENE
jgi:hypothetical protein